MEYKLVQLNEEVAVGKTFEIATSEIQTVNYGMFYNEVCKGMNPIKSFGIYEVGTEVTKFTVGIETEEINDYSTYILPAGAYYEFEIDMMENMKENQYVKCFEALENAGVEYDRTYSYEVMDQSINPAKGQTKYKYYIKAN